MDTRLKFTAALLGAALMGLAGCRDNDVPSGNNSSSILDGRPDDGAATEQVDANDVIPEEYQGPGRSSARIAIATLQPTQGNTASGVVVFIQPTLDDARVRVVAQLINVPEGTHGFHIHDVGNCSAPDASSAGEHFNPTGEMHGGPDTAQRHAGDLGNLIASSDQTAELDFYDTELGFNGVNSVIDKAFIVHAMPDDLMTQPSGASGDRIACGVIKEEQGV